MYFQVTATEQLEIQEKTVGQANNPLWFKHKKGRISASNAKRFTGKGNVATLTKDVISVKKPRITNIPAMKYGIDNEPLAIEKYKTQKSVDGFDVEVSSCGLFIDTGYGQLAASPDGLVTDNSASDKFGLIEVKCIYSCRDISPLDAVKSKGGTSAFPVKLHGDSIIMKESHSYYYQVQMQMGITGRKWCDFVLFTCATEEVLILHVYFDNNFWCRLKEKLLDFHSVNIVPALVAQGFYK